MFCRHSEFLKSFKAERIDQKRFVKLQRQRQKKKIIFDIQY
jgi:hypothetical protein